MDKANRSVDRTSNYSGERPKNKKKFKDEFDISD